MSATRTATRKRKTGETDIVVSLALDGSGKAEIDTGIGFFDHMLTALARHGLLDLKVSCKGDLEIDEHHTVEDVGIVIGQALAEAVGDKAGIRRYGYAYAPMDEALGRAALDFSGRGLLCFRAEFSREMVGDLSTELVEEFWRAVAVNAGITLHLHLLAGSNAHHQAESLFKAAALAIRWATRIDPDVQDIPSTKGVL
ncbi:MAG: imidazoleglycerol-phosphate dehydratase HisB [Candidatus Glassbacteria bacterium]|nr:imidazoleglycerol-phosphate dehydratase HisB [Candidatus Glassbacteria bacterium]